MKYFYEILRFWDLIYKRMKYLDAIWLSFELKFQEIVFQTLLGHNQTLLFLKEQV